MIDEIFAVSPAIRYVAVGRGLDYLVVAYGNFFQLVLPHGDGHVSVAIERSQSPTKLVDAIRGAIR